MRVCFILSTRGTSYGGLETIADQLAAGLAARGHPVSYLAGFNPGAPRRRDLPAATDRVFLPCLPYTALPVRIAARLTHTAPLNLRSWIFFCSGRLNATARAQLACSDAAITFLEGDAVLFSKYLAARHIPSIYYFSGGIDLKWAWRDRSTLRLAISQTVANQVRERYSYPTHGVLTPGVPSELLNLPLRVHNTGESYRLVYVGRLEPNKRVERLLPIVQTLTSEFPDLTLRLVGDGPSRMILEHEVQARGLLNTVHFCGAMSPTQVTEELRRADLFLFPSSYESFGVAVLEAMAAGAPVIASDLPALHEVTGGHAVLLPDDTAAWMQAARELLGNDARRLASAHAGREWAAAFTWERKAVQLEEYLEQACKGYLGVS
ncbi:MAG TPA: glycosyltransferase family 4 protein [Anaerolineae bacterium]|nr:glycosyltransferase family 4 protein [Anaerolineae bacterium]